MWQLDTGRKNLDKKTYQYKPVFPNIVVEVVVGKLRTDLEEYTEGYSHRCTEEYLLRTLILAWGPTRCDRSK